jgi:hypothetical protein
MLSTPSSLSIQRSLCKLDRDVINDTRLSSVGNDNIAICKGHEIGKQGKKSESGI